MRRMGRLVGWSVGRLVVTAAVISSLSHDPTNRLTDLLGSPLAAQQPPPPPDLEQSRKRIEEIRAERERLERQQSRLQGQLQDVTTELHNLERQRDITNRLVNEIERQINGLGTQLDQSSAELDPGAGQPGGAARGAESPPGRHLQAGTAPHMAGAADRRIVRRPALPLQVPLSHQPAGPDHPHRRVAPFHSHRPAAHPAARSPVRSWTTGAANATARCGASRRWRPTANRACETSGASTQETSARINTLERDEAKLNEILAALERRRGNRSAPVAGGASTLTTEDIGRWTGRCRGGSSTGSAATPCRAAGSFAGTGSGSRTAVGRP